MFSLLPVIALALSASANPIISSPNGVLSSRELVGLQRRSKESSLNETALKPWVLVENLGNLSPYHVPDSDYTLELPETCVVDQVSLMQRHGSRLPLASEQIYSQNVSDLFKANASLLANVSGKYEFLKTWTTKQGHDDLTAPGRKQLFENGVNFNLSYPHLTTDVLLAGYQDRVVESAEWFQMGYFGQTWANDSTLNFILEDKYTYSYITPMNNCSLWQYAYGLGAVNEWNAVYLPPIAARLSSELPGFNFTLNNVHGMLYALAYELAAYGSTPWSGVFLQSEVEAFTYELDLLMNYAFGYGLPYNLGPVLGSLYVNTLLERLTNSTGNATEMYIEFGHDTTIDLALTALGLAKDTPNIPSTGPVNSTRAWSTSSQVPFGAKFVTERISCSSSSNSTNGTETFVRFLLNDAPFPITTCGSKMNASTGACPLDTFVEINAFSANITHATYDQVCNNTGTVFL
ncbi:histidine phosphatase superfamily [Mrakia frigida]|uniref:histidine phosphatase superfamily n=1 Tax=Mrakia frigida TaxID=29902 RepID=UPI003FCC149F